MPSPSFHKLVLPSTLQAKKLRLPDDFAKKYGGNISSIVTLTVPDGSAFATSEINYKSPEQSSNKAPHFAKRLEVFEDLEDEDSIEMMHLSPTNLTHSPLQNKAVSGSADKVTPGKSHSPPALKNLFNGSKLNSLDNQMTRDVGLQFNVVEFKKSTEEVKLRTATDEKVKKTGTKKRKSDVLEPPSEHEDEVEMRNRFYESASARKRTVTAEEREKAMNEAKAFEPSNPFCRVVLRPSYLYRGCIMYLPSCFAEKHLNGISGFIKLQISDGGKQWSVRCLYKDGKAKLSQGWFEFALENNLGEGDVCVFELVAADEVVLQVTFFRITEDEGLSSPPPLQQNQHVTTAKLLKVPFSMT
ncbi:hypothetical protein P8452_32416 [Trifolium repens]|nr:hypothetical protein P8452_32416 [Trifolium repens]